jgi:hypothetical protein
MDALGLGQPIAAVFYANVSAVPCIENDLEHAPVIGSYFIALFIEII